MPLVVELSTSLRRYVPGYDARRGLVVEVGPGRALAQVVADLGIPREEVAIIMLNRVVAGLDQVAHDGDLLGLFPPLGGG